MATGYHLRAKQKARARPGPTLGILSGSGFRSGLSPPEMQKAPAPTRPLQRGSCGTGTLAQALVDIYDVFVAAAFAVDLQALGPGFGVYPEDPPFPAGRAHEPSVLDDQCISFSFRLQCLPLTFYIG